MSNLNSYLSVYEFDVTLPVGGDLIKIKPLTTNGMKKLLVYENVVDPIETEIIIDTILGDYIITEDINVLNLYVQDRYFLFVELRKISKGSGYKFEVTCPYCGGQSMQKFDLETAKISVFDPKNFQNELIILNGSLILEMKLCKRSEQFVGYGLIDTELSSTEKKVEMILMDLALSVESIKNKEGQIVDCNIQEKVDFIGNLPQSEYEKIKNWLESNYYGYNLKIDIKCPHCNKTIHNQNVALDNFL